MLDAIIGKQQFWVRHNQLSPRNLQATFLMLTRFQEAKRPLLKDADWSFRLRIPFIIWLETRATRKKKIVRKKRVKSTFAGYPQTK